MTIQYKPFSERTADTQYYSLLQRIRTEGEEVDSQQAKTESTDDEQATAIQLVGQQLVFDLSNGFPITTERDLCTPIGKGRFSIFHQALGELFAFLHGARTLTELEAFECFWWKAWATEAKCRKRGLEIGDNGPGFYGAAWCSFPTTDSGSFNQVQHMVEQINELPHLRTHFLTPWVPQYLGRGKGKQQKVTVVPCHGLVHVLVNSRQRTLQVVHFQRSADVPVGLVANLIQYAALAMMLAQVTGYRATKLHWYISDAHMYRGQLGAVNDLLSTTSRILPTVTIDPSIKNLLDFRQHHFKVSDYYPEKGARRIWTPV